LADYLRGLSDKEICQESGEERLPPALNQGFRKSHGLPIIGSKD